MSILLDEHPRPMTPAGAGELLELLDVSDYQGAVDWARVAAAGVAGVYCKATEGSTLTAKRFATDWQGARAAGLLAGAYHFLTAGSSGADQARHFLATYQAEQLAGALAVALDVESGHGPAIADIACAFLEVVEAELGECVVYTYAAFQGALGSRPELGSRRLWLAAYHPREEPTPAGPWKGQAWWAWQYTGKGRVDGVAGDVDRSRVRWLP